MEIWQKNFQNPRTFCKKLSKILQFFRFIIHIFCKGKSQNFETFSTTSKIFFHKWLKANKKEKKNIAPKAMECCNYENLVRNSVEAKTMRIVTFRIRQIQIQFVECIPFNVLDRALVYDNRTETVAFLVPQLNKPKQA